MLSVFCRHTVIIVRPSRILCNQRFRALATICEDGRERQISARVFWHLGTVLSTIYYLLKTGNTSLPQQTLILVNPLFIDWQSGGDDSIMPADTSQQLENGDTMSSPFRRIALNGSDLEGDMPQGESKGDICKQVAFLVRKMLFFPEWNMTFLATSLWSRIGVVLAISTIGALMFIQPDDGLPYICSAKAGIIIEKGGFPIDLYPGSFKQMPYFYDASQGDLYENGNNVTTFIIVQHGWSHDGHEYACHIARALRNAFPDASDRKHIRVIAPQFYWLPNSLADVYKAPGFSPTNDYFWENRNFQFGVNSSVDDFKRSISSYEVYDKIITSLCNNTNYPNLQKVKLVGFSGGAQLLQRYSVWGAGMDIADQYGIDVEVLIGNPNVFAYFNASRPLLNVTDTCNKYGFVCGAPEQQVSFYVPSSDACPENYNSWGWGIEDINVPYMNAINNLQTGIENFGKRKVVYLAATSDSCNKNIIYPHDEIIDYSCAVPSGSCSYSVLVSTKQESHCGELLQGFCRYQRIHIWYQYISEYYSYEEDFVQKFIKVPGVRHEPKKVFASYEACCPLFGEQAECCDAEAYSQNYGWW